MDILRLEQADYDANYFDNGYRDLTFNTSKIEHIGAHIGKILGVKAYHWSVSGWETEQKHSVVMNEVIPDLAIYRTQLANIARVDDEVLEDAAQRFAGGVWKPTKQAVYSRIAKARGLIDCYVEPLRHGGPNQTWMPAKASINLHQALAGLEYHYGLEPGEVANMHRRRLIDNAERMDYIRDQIEAQQNLSTR